MTSRRPAKHDVLAPLLNLIEQRFDVRLERGSVDHLKSVTEHYNEKRRLLLMQHGEAGALANADYAKAVLISEAARLMLREIDPLKRRKKKSKGTP